MRTQVISPFAGLARLKLVLLIAFFAILLAVAIPLMSMFESKWPDRWAVNDTLRLKMGIRTYFTEYREFPTRRTGPEDSNQPEFSDRYLMKHLTESSEPDRPGLSPRSIPFVSFKKARMTNAGTFHGGVSIDSSGDMELWDPWGNHYRVVMDTSGDGVIPAPSFDPSGAPIKDGVIVWSPGPDGDDSTVEDNVMTWRP